MFSQTSQQFWKKMHQLNTKSQENMRKDSAYAFDAAWIIALALNTSFANGMTYKQLLRRGDTEVVTIREGIQSTKFQGITVSAFFCHCLSNIKRQGLSLIYLG